MDVTTVQFDKPDDLDVFVGRPHLVRRSGNDVAPVDVAVRGAEAVGAGRRFGCKR